MSEGKEEKEKVKKITVFDEMNGLSNGIQAAFKMQESIMNSGLIQSMRQMDELSKQMSRIFDSFKDLEGVTRLAESLAIATKNFESISLPTTGLNEALKEINEIGKKFAEIDKLTRLPNIDIPTISREIKIIPRNNNTIIKVLEEKIKQLQKQLAQKDAEIRQLLVLLNKKRKDLRKGYVV